MAEKKDSIFLQHIRDAMARIDVYLKGISRSQFAANHLVQDGVIRQLEIIGEATKNISSALRKTNPEIPWKDMAGMRDKLIHGYFGVDLDTVWHTAQKVIPAIKPTIEKMIKSRKR